jgi:hypothetical protein
MGSQTLGLDDLRNNLNIFIHLGLLVKIKIKMKQ